MGAACALENLGVEYKHGPVSEIDGKAREVIKLNFGVPDEDICRDIMGRENARATACDIYTAGFPCQAFSSEGLKEGEFDRLGRGLVVYKVVDYIERQLPPAFVMENVKGFTTAKFKVLRRLILAKLRAVKRLGKPAYRVRATILNSRNHGVPQSRPRYYIVGTRIDLLPNRKMRFQWPRPTPTSPSLDAILDKKAPPKMPTNVGALQKVLEAHQEAQEKGYSSKARLCAEVLSGPKRKVRVMNDLSPCLTRARCGSGGHYIMHKRRMMLDAELLKLQGFDPNRIQKPASVTQRQLNMMVGNAFTVTAMERILARVLKSIGKGQGVVDRFGN